MNLFSFYYYIKIRDITWFLVFYQKARYFIRFLGKLSFSTDIIIKFFLGELVNRSKFFQKNLKKISFEKEKKRKKFFVGEKIQLDFFNYWEIMGSFFIFFFPKYFFFPSAENIFLRKRKQNSNFFLKKISVFINLIKIENWIKFQKIDLSGKKFFISSSKQTRKTFQFIKPKIKLAEVPFFLSVKTAKKVLSIGLEKSSGIIFFSFFHHFMKSRQKSINCLENYVSFLSIFIFVKFFSELQSLPIFQNFFAFFKYKKKFDKIFLKFKEKTRINNIKILFFDQKTPKFSRFFLAKKTHLEKNFKKSVFFPKSKVFKKFLEVFEKFSEIFWEIEKMGTRISLIEIKDFEVREMKSCQGKKNFFILKKKILDLIKEIKNFFSIPLFLIDLKLSEIKKNLQINPVKKLYDYKKILRNLNKKLSLKICQKNHRIGFFRFILPLFQFSFHLINFKNHQKNTLKTLQKSTNSTPEALIKFCKVLSLVGSKIAERSSSFLFINRSYNSPINLFFNSNQIFYLSKKNFF